VLEVNVSMVVRELVMGLVIMLVRIDVLEHFSESMGFVMAGNNL